MDSQFHKQNGNQTNQSSKEKLTPDRQQQQFYCQQKSHEEEDIIYICMEPTCIYQRLACSTCIVDNHKIHANYMLKIKQILKGDTLQVSNWPHDDVLKKLSEFLKNAQEQYNEETNTYIKDMYVYIDQIFEEFQGQIIEQIKLLKEKYKNKINEIYQNDYKDFVSLYNQFEYIYTVKPLKNVLDEFYSKKLSENEINQYIYELVNKPGLYNEGENLKSQFMTLCRKLKIDPKSPSNFSIDKTIQIEPIQLNKAKEDIIQRLNRIDNSFIQSISQQKTKSDNSQTPEKQKYSNNGSPTLNQKLKKEYHSLNNYQSPNTNNTTNNFFIEGKPQKECKYKDNQIMQCIKSAANAHKNNICEINYIQLSPLESKEFKVNSIRIGSDNYNVNQIPLIVSSSWDNSIKIWNPSTGTCLRTIPNAHNYVDAIQIMYLYPDELEIKRLKDVNSILVSCGNDTSLKFWDWKNNRLICQIEEAHENGFIFSLKVIELTEQQQQGLFGYGLKIPRHLILSAGIDGNIKVWNWLKRELVRTLSGGHSEGILCLEQIQINEDTLTIATGGMDKQICIWNVLTSEIIIQIHNAHTDHINCLLTLYIPNDNINQFSPVKTSLKIQISDSNIISTNLKFSKKSPILISAADDRSIKIWNIINGVLLKVISNAHSNNIRSLSAIQYTEQYIFISAGWDKTFNFWNLQSDTPIYSEKDCQFIFMRSVQPVELITKNNELIFLLYTAGKEEESKSIKIWKLNISNILTNSKNPQLIK